MNMKTAKIISFIAFIFNSYLSVRSFGIFLKIRQTFRELQIPTPIPWPFILDLIFAIGSIIYCSYLWKKERKREKVKFALLVSIALLITPFLVTILVSGFLYSKPIYDYLEKIR